MSPVVPVAAALRDCRARRLAGLLALACLAACGGGHRPEDPDPAASGQIAGSVRDGILAVAPTNVWTKCADEGGLCVFTGTKAVRFGKGSTWSETLIFEAGALGGARCATDTSFYNDPVPNAFKECQLSDVSGDTAATRATQGEWSPLQSWPIVPVHLSLLPSGRVLAHNSTNDDLWPQLSVTAQVWNPLANTFTPVDSRDATLKSELFCTGFTHLPDGSVLTTGNQPNVGKDHDRNVNRFSTFTQTWSREGDTAFYRYYPSVAAMPNGDLMTFAGTAKSAPAELMRFDGSWKTLSAMTLAQDFNYYGWGQAAPNGKLFYAGPDTAMRFIDPVGPGSMTELGAREQLNRNYGSYAIYDTGKMLVAGGAQPATTSAVTIDFNGGTPTVVPTGSMAFARRHGNLTILADGSVLATGGYTGSSFTDVTEATAVLNAERWMPSTGKWTTLAGAQRVRAYHSTAMLLPDGRVVVGGNGMPYATGYEQQNVEIFSPPYLFQGTGKYATKSGVTGSVGCNNATFGDPLPGTVKSCSYVATTSTAKPSDAVSCATENALCALPSGAVATVYYGASGEFTSKTGLDGNVACNNATFGDPIFGSAKHCSYVVTNGPAGTAAALAAGAQQCAAENGTCTLPSGTTATVYYGAGAGTAGAPAVRPTIGYAPDSIGYGNRFIVKPGQASGIARVHLIKLGSVTHANNQGQRLVPLSFSVSGASLQVNAPASPNIAPPGYYMLFVVDDKGTPSIARMVQVQQYPVVALLSRQTGKALEVVPGANAGGTGIQMMGDDAQPNLNKSWELVPADGGNFKLVSRATGAVLSVPGSSMQAGTGVQALPDASGANQQWNLTRTSSGYFAIKARHSGFGLEVANASTADGAEVVQQSLGTTPGTNDEWVVMPVGYQRLVGLQSGKVAEVAGRSDAAGAAIEIATNAGDTHQSFRFVPRGEGYFSIEAAHSGSVIGVAGGSTEPVTVLQQQAWSGATAQQWALVPQNDGTFMLQARHSGHYMNVLHDKVDTGASVGQYPDNGGLPNQYWRLIPAVSLDPYQRNATSGRAIASGHVANVGWLPWVAASNTIGQPETGNNLEALKISARGVRPGLQISYRAQSPGGAWQAWVGDNQQAGTTGQSAPIQGFQAMLGGARDSCAIRYRAYLEGAGWQAWSAEGQTAGVANAATPLTGLQLIVECTNATMAYHP